MTPFSHQQGAKLVWFHKDQRKSNQYCPYCGSFVGHCSDIVSNKEHLIGRSFVPAGSLSDAESFNFIFRCCAQCNTEKSGWEGYVSAVGLSVGPARSESAGVHDQASRKEKAVRHRGLRNVPVGDAKHTSEIKHSFGNGSMKFGLVAPAQHHAFTVDALATCHVQGLFGLVTSQNPAEADGQKFLPKQNVFIWDHYAFQDWGNPHAVCFAERVAGLDAPVNICSANGYFKAKLIRLGGGSDPWFWVLEWNKQLRVVGWIGNESQPSIFDDLPDEGWSRPFQLPDGSSSRVRSEMPLRQGMEDFFEEASK